MILLGFELKEIDWNKKLMPMIECDDERVSLLEDYFMKTGGSSPLRRLCADVNVMQMNEFIVCEMIFTEKNFDMRFTLCVNENPSWFKLLGHGMILFKDKKNDGNIIALSLPSQKGIDKFTGILQNIDQVSDIKSFKHLSDLT